MTPQDLKQISNLFDKRFDKIDKDIGEIKTDVSSLKTDVAVLKYQSVINEKAITKLNNSVLRWKSDMFDAAEKFMKETIDQREFRLVGSHQITSNTDRIEKLEKKVFGNIIGA